MASPTVTEPPTVEFAPPRGQAARSTGVPPAIALLLACGALLVAYSYLVGLWPVRHGATPAAVLGVREWLTLPLGLGEDFGALGLGLLMIGGGYLAAGTAGGRLRPAALFAHAYLPYALAVTVSWVLLLAGGEPLTDPAQAGPAFGDYLRAMLAVDRLGGGTVLVVTGLPAAVGGLFCLVLVGTRRLARGLPSAAVAVHLLVPAALVVTGAAAIGWYRGLGLLAWYAAFPVFGMLLRARRARRITAGGTGVAALGCLALTVAAERVFAELGIWWYPLTFAYAALLSLVVVEFGDRYGRAAPVAWLGARAWPLVLMVGAVGYPALTLLAPLPGWAALTLALAAVLGAAEAAGRLSDAVAP